MKKYIAAIDQGTTSTRFIIFNHAGEVVAADDAGLGLARARRADPGLLAVDAAVGL